ncbi:cyanophycinase [bacterium]|nr:cyanophycinase [candidate division CSSED10-310 bacterium]
MNSPSSTRFVLLGGSFNDRLNSNIVEQIVNEAGGTDGARIVIVPSASTIPEKLAEKYRKAFIRFSPKSIDILNIRSPEEAESIPNNEKLKQATAVVFTGGDQLRLVNTLSGTRFLNTLFQLAKNGLIICGSSAGAMALGDPTIMRGRPKGMINLTELVVQPGFGILKQMIVETHLSQRNRFSRLFQAVSQTKAALGLGLDEDTGVVITRNNVIKALGNGTVVILDGRNITYFNTEPDSRQSFAVSDIRVHLLRAGNGFDIESSQFVITA